MGDEGRQVSLEWKGGGGDGSRFSLQESGQRQQEVCSSQTLELRSGDEPRSKAQCAVKKKEK